jgi:soluble lytic murein transglycosylase-like protein
MKSLHILAGLAAMAMLLVSPQAFAQQRAQYDALVAAHARANNVPEALVHRIIVRESRYRPDVVGRGGAIGLMQISSRPRAASVTPATPRACAIPIPIWPTA